LLTQLRPYLVGAAALPIIAGLYWAQSVLIPVALALLLAFLLGPPVRALQRTGLGSTRAGRVVSVVLVVALVFSLLGGISYVMAQQIVALTQELPQYRGNLRQKIADLGGVGKPAPLKEMESTAKEVIGELQKHELPKRKPEPVPVTVTSEPIGFRPFPRLLDALTSAGFVIVLVIFMLIERQDLRNRLIRLIGYGRLAVTTKALDDANDRITRYLLFQTIINLTYGIAIGVGLFFIGVPYVVLWGFLAFALRFVPYVGPWLAALAPLALSLAAFTDWQRPLLAAGLFLAVEALTYMVIEPFVYRQALGLSQTALLVAIAFWTWLWGPIGLLLGTPLTVCLVVLGKHVPALEFITILMTDDEPALRSDVAYYQRVLARDQAEAKDIVEAYLRAHTLEEVYDDILIPALTYAKRDRELGQVSDDEVQAIYRAAMETITHVASTARADDVSEAGVAQPAPGPAHAAAVLSCATGDEAGELALRMLQQLLMPHAVGLEVGSPRALTGEVLALVAEKNPSIVCIGSIHPDDLGQTRHLCKRLRAGFPALRILVGRWGTTEPGERDQLLASGADAVGSTLRESRDQIRENIRLDGPAPARAAQEVAELDLPEVTPPIGHPEPLRAR
jgi:predicted PurR-regulated permease PerM